MMNVVDMTVALMEYKGMNIPTFAEFLEIPTQTLYDMRRGKTKKFSRRIMNKLTAKMPEIRVEWLLKGEGDMLKPANVIQSIDQQYIEGDITNTMTTVDKVLLDELQALSRQVDNLIEVIKDMQKSKKGE